MLIYQAEVLKENDTFSYLRLVNQLEAIDIIMKYHHLFSLEYQ